MIDQPDIWWAPSSSEGGVHPSLDVPIPVGPHPGEWREVGYLSEEGISLGRA